MPRVEPWTSLPSQPAGSHVHHSPLRTEFADSTIRLETVRISAKVGEYRELGPQGGVVDVGAGHGRCPVLGSVGSSISRGSASARVLSYQVQDAIDADLLVIVLEGYEPQPLPVHLLHQQGDAPPLKLRSFLDFVTPRLRRRMGTRHDAG